MELKCFLAKHQESWMNSFIGNIFSKIVGIPIIGP